MKDFILTQNNRTLIPGLNGLRAIAIAGVFFYHLYPGAVKGGFLGVSLFFILTGYLMVVSCESAWKKNQFRIISFYKKRISRIYPALLLTIIFTLAVSALLVPDTIVSTRGETLSILLGYNNWWQIGQNASYFTKITGSSPFTHLWFLSVEIQFYLLWPLVYFFVKTAYTYRARFVRIVTVFIVAIVSGILMTALYVPGDDPSRVYYGTDTRIFALLLGSVLGFLHYTYGRKPFSDRKINFLNLVAVLMVIITVALFFLMDGENPMTYQGGLLISTFFFVLLLHLLSNKQLAVGYLLDNPVFSWIGARSYEIYLCLYPVMYLYYAKGYMLDHWYSPLIIIFLTLLFACIIHFLTVTMRRPKVTFKRYQLQLPKKIRLIITVFVVALTCFMAFSLPESNVTEDQQELASELEENQELLQQQAAKPPTEVAPLTIPGPVAMPEDYMQQQWLLTKPLLPPKAPAGTITAIGDSVMLGAVPKLQEYIPGCIINAKESRQFRDGIKISQNMAMQAQLGDTVIIGLGTNGPFEKKDAEAFLDYLGSDRSIYLITAYGKKLSWQNTVNSTLHQLAMEYDNVKIIDWANVAPYHPEWFYKDGIHLKADGQIGYAKFIFSGIQ